MSSFIQKIRDLFTSEEKKFTKTLLEELKTTNFINIRKIQSNLSLEKRYVAISDLLSNRKMTGVFLPEKSHFFSILDEELSEIRNSLKKQGMVEISLIKNRWTVTEKTLLPLLNHLEKGIIGDKKYFTITYLQNAINSSLTNVPEYEIQKFETKFGIEVDTFAQIIINMIENEILKGVLRHNLVFLSSETFENIVTEFLEDKFDSKQELSFDEISSELEVPSTNIEPFLVSYVNKNPGSLVIYPLEKKIIFKG